MDNLEVLDSGMIRSGGGGGLGPGVLQVLEFYRCQQWVSHPVALSVAVVGSLDRDDSIRARHLQDQIGIMGDHHELSNGGPPEEWIVCCFKIGYLKLHVLSVEIFRSPEHHEKGDMTNKGCCCASDYSMEGILTRTQC
jgi:hypothetical protein